MDFDHHYRLLCPGPVNVDRGVAAALVSADLCHREDEFSALLGRVTARALEVAGLAAQTHSAVFITGSGTAANEAVLASAVPADSRVVVLSNGEFGERLAAISATYHDGTIRLDHEWGSPLDLTRLEQLLDAQPCALIAMVHHETSTGMLNPVAEVGRLAKRYGAKFFVDMVSSFSADPMDMAAAGITFATTSSGKALCCYPGLALVFGSHEAFRELQHHRRPCHYLDLFRYYEFSQRRLQTPNTPAVPLFLALEAALAQILAEGVDTRIERLRSTAARLRGRLTDLGLLSLLPLGEARSNVVTSVWLPPGLDYEPFRQALRDSRFVVYGGKGPFEGRMFQVSTIGGMDEALLDEFIGALESALQRGYRPLAQVV